MDLMNLNDELKYGKVLDSGKNLVIVTPLARLDFCTLATPEQYKNTGAFRYGLDMIFETDPTKPAAVDPKKILIPALGGFAKEKKVAVQMIKTDLKNGYALGGDRITVHTGQRFSEAGEPYEGYEKSSVWLHCASTPKVQSPPWKGITCFSPANEELDPRTIYNGCYGRVIINPYKPKAWNIIAIGLKSVQMIADGDSLGGGEGGVPAGAFGAVEGASVANAFEQSSQDPTDNGDFSSFM